MLRKHGREMAAAAFDHYAVASSWGPSLEGRPLIGIPKPSPGPGHGPGSSKIQIDKYAAYWLVGFKELIGNPEVPAGSCASTGDQGYDIV